MAGSLKRIACLFLKNRFSAGERDVIISENVRGKVYGAAAGKNLYGGRYLCLAGR